MGRVPREDPPPEADAWSRGFTAVVNGSADRADLGDFRMPAGSDVSRFRFAILAGCNGIFPMLHVSGDAAMDIGWMACDFEGV